MPSPCQKKTRETEGFTFTLDFGEKEGNPRHLSTFSAKLRDRGSFLQTEREKGKAFCLITHLGNFEKKEREGGLRGSEGEDR